MDSNKGKYSDEQQHRLARFAKSSIPGSGQKMTLAFRCIDVPNRGSEFDKFMEMQEKGRDISFETFARHVDWKPIAQQMGYDTGLTKKQAHTLRLNNDYAVRFKTSHLDGEKVYYQNAT